MTVALISLAAPQSVVAIFGAAPPMLALPDGRQVQGASAGWLSQDGGFSLVNVPPFVVPGGQQISGPAQYSVSGGVVTQTFPTQPIPAGVTAQQTQATATMAGVTLTWSVSTTLNGTYPIDPPALSLMLVEAVSLLAFSTFTNGTNSTQWVNSTGSLVTLNVAQFKAFFLAVFKFVRSLELTEIQAAAGQVVTWPNNAVSVTG